MKEIKNAADINIINYKSEKSKLKSCKEPEVMQIRELLIENSPHLPLKLFNIIKFWVDFMSIQLLKKIEQD